MKLIRLAPNSKIPVKGESWKEGISDDPDEHAHWLAGGYNVGFPLEENGRVVVDYDRNIEAAREHYRRTLCEVIVKTARGVHFHYSGQTKTRKFEDGDIKGNGYVVFPPSTVNGHQYQFIKRGELQPFPEHLFPIIEKEVKPTITEDDPMRRLKRAMAWMKKREGGVDGSGRGLAMIKTCRALFQMFGLTEDQALPLILEFNERECKPPYTDKELRHKIEDSQKGLVK